MAPGERPQDVYEVLERVNRCCSVRVLSAHAAMAQICGREVCPVRSRQQLSRESLPYERCFKHHAKRLSSDLQAEEVFPVRLYRARKVRAAGARASV